jgi:hypothetical protein
MHHGEFTESVEKLMGLWGRALKGPDESDKEPTTSKLVGSDLFMYPTDRTQFPASGQGNLSCFQETGKLWSLCPLL